MIPTKKYDLWYTINADNVTSVYFTGWSVNCKIFSKLKDINVFSRSLEWSYFTRKSYTPTIDSDTMGILETGPEICNISSLSESWSKYLDDDKSQRVLQIIIITLNKKFKDIHAIRQKK